MEQSKKAAISFFIKHRKRSKISGSSNGILCISDQHCYPYNFRLNLSIGVFKLPPFSDFTIATVENSFTLLRFGYLQEEDDYKVIRCFRMYDKPFVDIDSYELEDLWRYSIIPSELQAAIFLGNHFLIQKVTSRLGRTGWYLIVPYDMSRRSSRRCQNLAISNYNFIELCSM
ncbi:hypothetical protein OIU74_002789 [Salix koriyanagi]|uniref:Uncharacterized protein n=1 Tax=Salix koriyanagi TaxID=2511006 RepID=A0A9Q0X4D3_9ROSI|nr:hypothetical protein OIU74_002789 [Salix koriyanagi]